MYHNIKICNMMFGDKRDSCNWHLTNSGSTGQGRHAVDAFKRLLKQ